ncbi:MAG TPA: efflux RND transporter permease subunit [Clostridiales bacterium]|mgnify:CR=1 FL=1|nr:efflux RND transporter permease subunit [Clostridiales bacterium]
MLSKFSVKRPYTIAVAVIVVLILGVISFINMQTDLLPNIDLPYVVITTSYPGASPEEVELVVTRPIEQVVARTNNIKNVSSISRENSSVVILEFNNDVNMDSAIIEINSNLDLIKGAWSDSVRLPMIIRINPDMLPIMVASADVEGMNVAEISKMVSEKVIPELESVNGVASVRGVGLLEENIEVTISEGKIDNLNKKILDSIDSKMAEAEDKLLKAKREVDEGKATLESRNKSESEKIAEGEKELTKAFEQISAAEKGLETGKLELIKNKNDLESALQEINKNEQELIAVEKALLALGKNISEEDKVKLAGIQKGLMDISGKKAEMAAAINELSNKIEGLEKDKALLVKQREGLNEKKEQIDEGKVLLAGEMSKARTQLIDTEKTINENLKELEISKEAAFKRASLDGVISTNMISGILAAQNFSMPAGYVKEEGTDYLVKVGNKIKDMDEIKKLLLFDTGVEGVGKVYLSDVADIQMKDNSKDIYAKVNGNDAVMLTFQKQSGFSTAEVAKSIRERANKIESENDGFSFTALMDQGVYIDIVVASVLKNIMYGGLLAILILLVFLRDTRPTVIIALSIPISIVFAVAMMYFTGVNINIISLSGLALGVGMLVDNSIVVIENIYRLRSEGESASAASIEGAKQVSGAIISSTLTTVCVFLPIVFVKGISKQLFTDMGLTIAYSLFASLIVALTLVPAMASSMLKSTENRTRNIYDTFLDGYEKMLRWSLKYKAVIMIAVVALLVLSAYYAASMGTSFIPDMEAPQMSITLKMPKESTYEDTIAMSDTVIDRIMGIEGIKTIGAFQNQGMGMGIFGSSSGRAGGNTMSMYLILDENKGVSNAEIEKEIKRLTDGLNAEIAIDSSNMDMSALGGSGIEVIVKGRELDTLRDIALDISKILGETEGTMEVASGTDENSTEIRITVDKEKSMEKGLTVAQVFSSVNSGISRGKSATTISGISKDYPVIVIDGENQSIMRKDLEDLKIKSNKNGVETEVRLGDIAAITEEKGLSSIRRKSQERYISVTAAIDAQHNIGLVSRDLENKLKDYKLPDGYRIEFAGENIMINDSLRDLTYMLLLAAALIYLIMVAQFQSLLSPFIVMFTIPLAFTGGLLALAITGNNISLIAMLGFLVLSGVVVNNGIVFVDYTNQLRDKGLSTKEALVSTGRTRMRPILMTAITTILGLSTLSAGVGVGSEMLQPLAIVSIGGLIYATVLTLFVVPIMYDSLHKNKMPKVLNEGDV